MAGWSHAVAGVRYVNLPAHMCSPEVSAPNPAIVRYAGEKFSIIGFFFVNGTNGASNGDGPGRTMYYVLRTVDGDFSNGLPLNVRG